MSSHRLKCPACGEGLKIRASKEQTPTFRVMYGQCQNLLCGATFSGSMSWDYALSPSGMDKPRVALPVSPSVARMKAMRELRENADQLDLLDAVEEHEAEA